MRLLTLGCPSARCRRKSAGCVVTRVVVVVSHTETTDVRSVASVAYPGPMTNILNGPMNLSANLLAPKFVKEVGVMPAVDNNTRSPTLNRSMLSRLSLSPYSFR